MSGWKPKPNQYTNPVYTKPKGQDPRTKIPIRRPLPGIVILVHGVNDIGEAYPTQASGICAGLNTRLGRGDLDAGDWDTPKSGPTMRRANPQDRIQKQGYSPVIPFYWGYRPVDKNTYEADQSRYKDELRKRGPANAEAPYDAYWIEGNAKRGYQNTDCFDNFLDKHFAKGGGVFANATTNLIDMWGPGGDISEIAQWMSKRDENQDFSHAIYENPHRIYIVNAARRLANLILMIRRDNEKTQNDTINIVAHSQGTLVSMLANFLVANGERPARPADCQILNHSPYSLEVPFLEGWQAYGPQQSAHARTQTLVNFCKLMEAHRQAGPKPADLVHNGVVSSKMADKPNHMRDNHGKVFNYFCLNDGVVSLKNVQGIGWKGVPTKVSDKAGPAFAQRMFVDGQGLNQPSGTYRLPKVEFPKWENQDVQVGELRRLDAPQVPDFGYVFRLKGEESTLGESDVGVNSAALGIAHRNVTWEIIQDPRPGAVPVRNGWVLNSDELADVQHALREQGKDWELKSAMGASESGKLMIERYQTEAELHERARETKTTISNHSALMLDPMASVCVTAFDLAIGQCRSFDEAKWDGGEFWQKLLRHADWRDSDALGDKPYYTAGILPKPIKEQMNKPPEIPGIVNETTTMRVYSNELQRLDEQIARMNSEKSRWPTVEWQERMRGLQAQRATLLSAEKASTRDSQLFPVEHQE
jgi:hypothetical protein